MGALPLFIGGSSSGPSWHPFWDWDVRYMARSPRSPCQPQKRLSRSICRLGCGLEWVEGCTNSVVFARWRQCALMGGHAADTSRITLNHPSTAAMRLMSNYLDHLSSHGSGDMPWGVAACCNTAA